MNPERRELVEGVKMAAVAVISAVITATCVIGLGHAMDAPDMTEAGATVAAPALIRTAG